MYKRLTPVLAVDAIEPSLEFWRRLGFEVQVEVPHGERLGFVLLARDGVQLMYQSRASLSADLPAAAAAAGTTLVYVEVSDLAAAVDDLAGAQLLVERRRTFYGATETVIREPGGHVVVLAQFDAAER